MAVANLSWRNIRWLLFDILRGRAQGPPVVKAIPLGFPILEAVHTIHERIPERIGLVHRYLLDGLCRFGPCSADDLDRLLGLGSDLVEKSLLELERVSTAVSRADRLFQASADGRKLLETGRFTRAVTHPRKFVVNGLTDTLLPIDFWRYHDEVRLFPDPDRPTGPMRDSLGNSTRIVVKIADRMGDGSGDLRRCIDRADAQTRERLGVPATATDLGPSADAVSCSWALALLLVAIDGTLAVLSASRRPVSLAGGAFAARDYLGRVCQGLSASELDPERDRERVSPGASAWPAGTEVRPGSKPGVVCVTVARPEEQLGIQWDSDDEETAEVRRLSGALISGLHWEIGRWQVLRLVPGNPATAARLCVLRAVRSLQLLLRDFDDLPENKASLDLAPWWQDWQTTFARDLPHEAIPPALPLELLLNEADAVPDTEFLEKLDSLLADQR